SVIRMGSPTSSRRKVRQSALTACFTPVYPAPPGYTSNPAIEPSTTTCPFPLARSFGRSAWCTRRTPSTFASYIVRHRSTSAFSTRSRAPLAWSCRTSSRVAAAYSRRVRLYQRSADRRPDPPPLATDDRATVLVGIGLWLVALVVTLVLHARLADQGRTWWIW